MDAESKNSYFIFLPYTEEIKKANKKVKELPADEWLHGRYEGQMLLEEMCEYLMSKLSDAGFESLAPSLDDRFWTNDYDKKYDILFTSNWSERHIAFVCGLGTFGLSKGLITRKGTAGRFGSILTDLFLTPDTREYKDVYEYCNMCGICAKKCPSSAISVENGKDCLPCYEFIEETLRKNYPRYGCGKCQVGVPCESRIPL
jgi:epoxyqueuosine reductase